MDARRADAFAFSQERTAAESELISFASTRPARRVALVGNYVPRKCGIATFTADLTEQLARFRPEIGVEVWALDDADDRLDYEGVTGTIDRADPGDYARAADAINASAVDAVWLQHEFGIFGGDDGAMVCDFIDRIAAPLIVTCHTVLTEPSANQRRILEHLVERASRIMVMSRRSRDLLIANYNAPAPSVEVIEHGAPDRPFGREEEFKARRGLSGRAVLTTFGLLGPGKGIERVIEALPAIRERHPEVLYRIVGATHPKLVARDGESYREGLKACAERLGVADAIEWDESFVETDELLDQLEACDIYLTPYPGLQQSTSGTLSYAVALGKAVISTPYVHARELLADGVGILIEPGSTEAIANAVCRLLDDPIELAAMKARAYARGRETIWPRFAAASASLIDHAVARSAQPAPRVRPSFHAVRTMSDRTGMFQHSIGIVPDRQHGYCLDDNVRALMLVNLAEGLDPRERQSLSMTYASFIQDAWNPDVQAFRNFMRFDRGWCEEQGSEDSNGRAIWALGRTALDSPDADIRAWANRLYDTALPSIARSGSPRTIAFVMLGAAAMLRARPHSPSADALAAGADVLERLLGGARRPDWAWFEAVLGYDNPRLPQALIEAGQTLGRPEWTALGLETLAWIAERQTAAPGHFRPIGSETFGREYAQMPFDQQPLEAQAAIEAALSAWRATGDEQWRVHGTAAWRWFFGANDRGVVLADLATGRCRDGITPRGANENCGAESILAFQLGHYSMLALAPDIAADSAKTPSGMRVEDRNRDGQRPLAYT
ncbi:glycosyl transferase [Tsuneonella deserti]|uniref:Glycosyl transferase n=1 Tax=Tsuneonella deserti TaxID=2035528 RepID=A0ABQ1S0H4_9SPHN|nr:glycosyltransferase family 4 protein [Tsuneonella deserti]GGD86496.1 glycosyl transferase [Tsuneonella deserti]